MSTSATKAVTALMAGSLFTKLITFTLNNLLIRHLSPEVVGSTSYIDFVISTVLFFSREAIRLSCQRLKEPTYLNNFGKLAMCIGFVGSCFVYFMDYPIVCKLLIWASIMTELASESGFLWHQFQMKILQLRSKGESFGILSSSIIQISCFMLGIDPVLAFCLGKLSFAMVLYYTYYHKYNDKKTSSWFDTTAVNHIKTVYFQILFKHFLTEGDKVMIQRLTTEEVGIYALISNYGSLLARMVFQPVEESVRLYASRQGDAWLVGDILKLYTYLSIIITIFGYNCAGFLLQFVVGSQWNIGSYIKTYMLYIPFLAMNGVLEAYFNSTASTKQIMSYSYWMSFSTAVFIGCCFFIPNLHGVMIANMLNMAMRISYCWFTVSLKMFKPSTLVTAMSLVIGSVVYYIGPISTFKQLFVDAALGAVLLCVMLFQERSYFKR